MKKIKHWWRRQDQIFKKDFKFQAVMLFIGTILCIFGNPAVLFIVIPVITHTLLYSDVFRIEKYAYIKIIKHHKDYIHILKEINKNEKRLISNLEDQLITQERLLNSTYVFVPWPESQKFTIHKRFNECFMVENGCLIPYDVYTEIDLNS
jgi:hypothetical protein